MKPEELVAHVRLECIDGLADRYAQMFTGLPVEQFSDGSMRSLASAWKAASPDMQDCMKRLIRLGSQNTAASILALLDGDFGRHGMSLSIVVRRVDGSQDDLGRDLLDTFWEQEEAARKVNIR